MIYANLVNCQVFVSLKPGARVLLDGETGGIDGAAGWVDSAGPDYMRLKADTITFEDDVLDGEEPMELTLHADAILLVQLLDEGSAIIEDDEEEDS